METVIFGMMRIKNEERWIARVIEAQLPLLERLYILDDHSTDDTRKICESFGSDVCVYTSPFQGLDESRDKQWLLDQLRKNCVSAKINADSPYWILVLDGDEILAPSGIETIRKSVASGQSNCYSQQIFYLWDREDQVRMDGVYGQFFRPSLFRLINPAFRYQKTPWGNGANFHCSQIPQEYLYQAVKTPTPVLHLGYMHRQDRLRKYEWYNRVDPDNLGEDCYRHMVIGDLLPANAVTKWAGPLRLVPWNGNATI